MGINDSVPMTVLFITLSSLSIALSWDCHHLPLCFRNLSLHLYDMVVISFRTICRDITAPPRILVLSYHRWACLAIRRSGEGGLLAPAFPFKQLSRHSNHSCHSCDKKQPPRLSRASNGLFFVYAAHFLRPLCDGLSLSPDGTSFNIQNPIPHPSQKEKVLLGTRRPKECQR